SPSPPASDSSRRSSAAITGVSTIGSPAPASSAREGVGNRFVPLVRDHAEFLDNSPPPLRFPQGVGNRFSSRDDRIAGIPRKFPVPPAAALEIDSRPPVDARP